MGKLLRASGAFETVLEVDSIAFSKRGPWIDPGGSHFAQALIHVCVYVFEIGIVKQTCRGLWWCACLCH